MSRLDERKTESTKERGIDDKVMTAVVYTVAIVVSIASIVAAAAAAVTALVFYRMVVA